MKQTDQTISVCYGTAIFPVSVQKNSRAKRVRLKINRKLRQAILVLPQKASFQTACNFARSKAQWIARQLDCLPEKQIFHENMSLPFLGNTVLVHHSLTAKRGVWIDQNVLWVSGKKEHLARRVQDFLKKSFSVYSLKKARQFAQKINVKVQRVTVRDTVSRWGSCSKSGRLNLSWRLVFAPLSVADYVIAHEVSHLCEMNHSSAFWKVVEMLCPDYQKEELWLKKNAAYLYSFSDK